MLNLSTNFLILFTFLIQGNLSFGQEISQPKPSTAHRLLYLSGAIDQKYTIQMTLIFEPQKDGYTLDATGTYFYNSQNKNIYLKGSLLYNTLHLTEYIEETSDIPNGLFLGTLTEAFDLEPLTIHGVWKSEDGKRQLPFILSEIKLPGIATMDIYHFEETYYRKRGNDEIERIKIMQFPQIKSPQAVKEIINLSIRNIFAQRVSDNISPNPTLLDLEIGTRANIPQKQELKHLEYLNYEDEVYGDEFSVLYNKNNILCLEILHYEYTGGVHGNYGTIHAIYDLTTGRSLNLESQLKPGWKPALTRLANEALRRQHNLKPEESLVDIIHLHNPNIELNTNWFICEEGLGFSYDPYEIAPYTTGIIAPVIPFHLLKSWIKTDSPLYKILPK